RRDRLRRSRGGSPRHTRGAGHAAGQPVSRFRQEDLAMSTQPIPADYDTSLTAKRADLTALGACWREFMSHFSPPVPGAAAAGAVAARLVLGGWSWRDAVLPVVLVAAQPFVEWVIHKYLLHLPPFQFRGKRVELYGSIQHRNHHLAPSDLDRVLL